MLTRVNAATGVAYRDDPTIFAWELINEPRVQGDASGDVLQAWIEDVAAHAKSLDRKHLLTVGSEGFYNGITDPTRAALHNPTAGAEQLGGDYTRNFFAPALDFACVHMWVDLWLSCDEACKLAFADTWIVGHLNASRAAFDKPVLLEEFGKWKPLHVRDDFFRRALEASMPPTSPVASHAAGSMFWHIDPTDYPYNEDGFSVQARGEAATADIVRGAAERAAASASRGKQPPAAEALGVGKNDADRRRGFERAALSRRVGVARVSLAFVARLGFERARRDSESSVPFRRSRPRRLGSAVAARRGRKRETRRVSLSLSGDAWRSELGSEPSRRFRHARYARFVSSSYGSSLASDVRREYATNVTRERHEKRFVVGYGSR